MKTQANIYLVLTSKRPIKLKTFFNSKMFLAALALNPYITHAQDNTSWLDSINPNFSDSDKWQVGVGIGVGYHAKYKGSDEYKTSVMPLIDVEWDNTLYFNPHDGIGFYAYQNDQITISAGIGYEGGRDESDDRDNLQGLGDIDGTAVFNLSMEYDLDFVEAYIDMRKHMGSTNGLQADIGIQTMIPLTTHLYTPSYELSPQKAPRQAPSLMFGLSTSWADENYTQEFFGVTQLQSINSGLSRYDIDAGFNSVNAELGFRYPIDTHWSVQSRIEYSKLIGDAADSPIVKDDSEVSGAVILRYQF